MLLTVQAVKWLTEVFLQRCALNKWRAVIDGWVRLAANIDAVVVGCQCVRIASGRLYYLMIDANVAQFIRFAGWFGRAVMRTIVWTDC